MFKIFLKYNDYVEKVGSIFKSVFIVVMFDYFVVKDFIFEVLKFLNILLWFFICNYR